jgi:CDP-glucose 4,6-dehydratase
LFLEKLDKEITLVDGSIDKKETLKRIFVEQNIEICFHLAAQVEVGVARHYPNLTWESNIRGTYNLLEAIREQGKHVKSVIIASSDKAYGSYPKNKMPYKENYELRAIFPYDVSKACTELIARSYTSDLYNLPIVITRFTNIYGPGQVNFSALIPDCFQSVLGFSKFTPRGNGENVRDFLYVKDVANLYILIAKELFYNPKKLSGEIFNAGSNKPMKIKNIVKTIFTNSNKKKDYEIIKNSFKNKKAIGEIDFQYMDHKKVKKYFGWYPKYNFNEGINETYRWYKDNIKKLI